MMWLTEVPSCTCVQDIHIIIAHEPQTLHGVGCVFEPWLQVIQFSHSCVTGWLEPEVETFLLCSEIFRSVQK